MTPLLKIQPDDNVAVAVSPIAAGTPLSCGSAREEIPAGHKIALREIKSGEVVRKYGFAIGVATRDIAPGGHVHEHNVRTALEDRTELAYRAAFASQPDPASAALGPGEFLGYRRPDGSVATRNEIWIINTVACVNVPASRIASLAAAELVAPGSGIDGIQSFSHPYGCSQLGDDLRNTRKILAGLARHPNAAAVLVLGLGCENNQLRELLAEIGGGEPGRIAYFNAQEVDDEVGEGLERIRALADYARRFHREPVPVSSLVLGMKCGGSDGFSGITANPLVGRVSDWLTSRGGTAILTEVPEMFGAEEPLLSRAVSKEVFDEGLAMINSFKNYFRSHGEPVG